MALQGRLIKSGLRWHRRFSFSKKSKHALQLKTLRKLLEKAKDTAFGKAYDFAKMLKSPDMLKAFQEAVPLFDYDSLYEQWWHRMVKGEANVCWPERVDYFALSSGTSGSPSKYIPVSKDMIRAMRRTNTRIFASSAEMGLPANFYDRQMLVIGSTINLRQEGPVWVGDVSGINTRHIPNWFSARFYKPGLEIAQLPTWEARIEQIVEQAPNWDIGTICGIPSWVQLMMEKIIARHQVAHVHEIWPNLQVYVSGGVAFAPYQRRFDQLCGKPMLYLDTYYTSEGCLAGQTRRDPRMPLELIVDNGIFFEFIPFNDQNFVQGSVQPQAQALSMEQVEEGVEYALVLSSCAGAWRYLIGDTVRFVDKTRGEILITGRTKHFLSITGEHLSVDNMNQAILHMEEQTGLHLPEFTVKALAVENHYEHHWFVACDNPPSDVLAFTQTMDEYICANNDDYATERTQNLLKAVRLRFLPSRVFYDWFSSKGKMGGQSKFPRVMNDKQYADWLAYLQTQNL